MIQLLLAAKKTYNSKQAVLELNTTRISTVDLINQASYSHENSAIIALYSVIAKKIIEKYKYDFSDTFIDILFFEDINLARTRTI